MPPNDLNDSTLSIEAKEEVGARITGLIADIDAGLIQSRALEETLQSCCEALVNHLDVALARIWTFHSEEDVLALQASAGMHVDLDSTFHRVPVGEYNVGLIAKEKQPHWTNSVVDDGRITNREWVKRTGIVAFGGVPLIVENRLIGVVAMFACHQLLEAEFQVLTNIANRLALFVEHKQVERQLREQTDILETVNRVGQALSSHLDLERLVQAVTDAATGICGASFGAFFYNVYNEQDGSYMLYTLSGVAREAFAHFPMPRATDLFGPTFRGEGTVLIQDVKQDPRYGKNSPHYGMPAGHLPVTSYLAVPVVSRSKEVIGGLFFGHPEPGVFRERDARVIEGLAAETAIAMDNARLYQNVQSAAEKAQRYATQLRGLTEVAIAIGSVNSVNEVLQVITDRAREVVGAHLAATTMANNNRVPPNTTIATSEEYSAWCDSERSGGYAVSSLSQHLKLPARLTGPELKSHAEMVGFDNRDSPMHCLLAVPLTAREGRHIGSILLLDKYEGDFTESDEAILVQLAQMASAAIEKARLFLEAEQANRAKDNFLSTLSHELRNPLNAIFGWTRILQLDDLDRQTFAEAVEIIDRSAKTQARLIDDMLDVSRIISGTLRLDAQPVELTAVINAALDSLRPAAEAKGIRVQAVLDFGAGMVLGDPVRLQQIVWNLLSNAIKFTQKSGRVQVLLARINSHLEITVSDNGPGISEDFFPYAFERFRQADSATSRQHGGLGLGLAIVRHLVELHGGTVGAANQVGERGAVFTVKLPLIVVRQLREPEIERPRVHPLAPSDVKFECPPELKGARLLVVDDEPDARSLLARTLGRCGATVKGCASAAEALQAINDDPPDVLISDIGMPEEDGFDLIRKVRQLKPQTGGQVPAVALTAYARVEDRVQSLTAGYNMHVPKPVEPAELAVVIASLIRSHRAT